MELGTARALRQAFGGPIYADLHSLLLAMPPDGLRHLQPLAAAPEWLGCFDAVQLNEEEMAQFGTDPMAVAAMALGAGVSLLVVTLGERGAVYFSQPAFTSWHPPPVRGGHGAGGPIRTGLIPAPRVDLVDPTGCGDVFGAGVCAALLAGAPPEAALASANRLAARNASLRGAGALGQLLKGQLVLAGERT
ncbi:MAG: carbohydrate kinase family protein [Gemmatimonadales bacterium]|nr:MAG: carbohydrate kinase family protein [Gemmatimonadales bacterium]